MNEFTRPDRLRFLAVSVGTAVVAVPLSFLLWRTPPGVAAPPAGILPWFIPIGVVIPALSFGLGVAFLLFGRNLLRTYEAPAGSRAAFLGIAWLLLSWWPHSNFHRVANGWANVVLVDYFFHVTVIVATFIVAGYFLSVIRAQQKAGQVATAGHDLATRSSA